MTEHDDVLLVMCYSAAWPARWPDNIIPSLAVVGEGKKYDTVCNHTMRQKKYNACNWLKITASVKRNAVVWTEALACDHFFQKTYKDVFCFVSPTTRNTQIMTPKCALVLTHGSVLFLSRYCTAYSNRIFIM